MTREDFVIVANIALAQKLHKRAAIQHQGESSSDKLLEQEEDKLNTGGSPAAATESTGQANAATFDVKPNDKKPSPLNGNKVPDNDNLSPRIHASKEASLSALLNKSAAYSCCGKEYKGDKCPECGKMHKEAAADIAGEGDKKLEKESDKLNLGGAPEGDVEDSSVSANNPDPVHHGGGKMPGDSNDNLSPRHHTQKSASENVAALKTFLKENPQVLVAR
jgi:hypothetical protein